MYYTGIGSRETPANICAQMTELAMYLEKLGYTLRSGGAEGADKAFESGAPTTCESYRPFGYLVSRHYIRYTDTTRMNKSVDKYHPAPQYLKRYVRKLMARNYCQVLGTRPLKSYRSDFIVCWTPDGSTDGQSRESGGTGQALRIACAKGIPVYNLYDSKAYKRLLKHIEKKGIVYKWARRGGYECSSKGDKRFSAYFANYDNKTIETRYQCDIKGYASVKQGKGQQHVSGNPINLWPPYLGLWKTWASKHPELVDELQQCVTKHDNTLSDCFATSGVNQARALAVVLNTRT